LLTLEFHVLEAHIDCGCGEGGVLSDLQSIKQRIHEEERIEELLKLLDCWGIDTEQGGLLFTAGLPDGTNRRSVQIKNNDYLNSHIRSKGIEGDIFTIVSYILYGSETEDEFKNCLSKSKYWLCKTLNYYEYIDEFYKLMLEDPSEKVNYNKWLHGIQKNRSKNQTNLANEVLSPSILDDYIMLPHIKWLDEGINYHTQVEFQVGFDVRSERIIFGIHDKHGNLIGVKGRYVGSVKEIKDNYKYIYLHPCNKSIELFNLHRALPYIKETKEVIVVEGAKTCMILHQWGYKNVVSIEGDSITSQQIKLIKELGIDIKVTFAWDKDKDIEFITRQISQLRGRMKYVLYDKFDLFEEKNSPADKGKEVFEKLLEQNKYKVGV
jgi:DNA primase